MASLLLFNNSSQIRCFFSLLFLESSSVYCFCSLTCQLMLLERCSHRVPAFWLASYVASAASQLWSAFMQTCAHLQTCYHSARGIQSTPRTPLSSSRLNLLHEGCVLIREGLVRCVVRPLWSPRSLVFFVP